MLGACAPCERPLRRTRAGALPARTGSQGAVEDSRVTLLLQVKSAASGGAPWVGKLLEVIDPQPQQVATLEALISQPTITPNFQEERLQAVEVCILLLF